MNNSNHKWWIFSLGTILSIIFPIIDIKMNFTDHWDSNLKFQTAIALGIFFVTLLATYIAIVFEKLHQNEIESHKRYQSYISAINNVSKFVNGDNSFTFPIDKLELYTKLNELVLNSHSKLELMYLGEKPPNQLEKMAIRDNYIKNLETIINKQEITIKRVILFNSANKQWIKQIATKFKTKHFFSLYLIEPNKIPSLSVQVIDNNKVIVINVLKKANVDKKHIYIDSENLNKIYHGLYNDIVEKSIPIIENGIFNSVNFDKYLK